MTSYHSFLSLKKSTNDAHIDSHLSLQNDAHAVLTSWKNLCRPLSQFSLLLFATLWCNALLFSLHPFERSVAFNTSIQTALKGTSERTLTSYVDSLGRLLEETCEDVQSSDTITVFSTRRDFAKILFNFTAEVNFFHLTNKIMAYFTEWILRLALFFVEIYIEIKMQ